MRLSRLTFPVSLSFLLWSSSPRFMAARLTVVAAQLESSASSPCLFLPQSLGKIDKPVCTQFDDQALELSTGNILRVGGLAAVHLPSHDSWSQQRIKEIW